MIKPMLEKIRSWLGWKPPAPKFKVPPFDAEGIILKTSEDEITTVYRGQ